MKDTSRWIIKQMFYMRPVAEEFPIALGYGIKGSWPWYLSESGLWISGQKDGIGNHPGTDFDAPEGTPVIAMADGYIGKAGWDYPQDPARGYGLRIRQTVSLSRWSLTYGHLSDIFVKPGAMVLRGHSLGRIGRTGQTTRPHLHCHLEDPEGQYHELSFDEES
jgi:murein DD-endopeptidase MepM/ murein hydrolase activator NlpD